MTTEQFVLALKDKGLKATAQRLAVHEAMSSLVHASADEVANYISEHSRVSISTASVYNILSQMAELGIYATRFSPDNKMHFDVVGGKHIHLYDAKSGDFIDIVDDELLELVENHVRHKRYKGYKVENIDIQIVCRPRKQQ